MKEFNIDEYQYTEEHISYEDFLRYGPLKNDLQPAATFNGTLFLHQGPEWEHIATLSAANIWTLYEEDGVLKIRNGYKVNGRLGYFHCNRMHNAHGTIIVDGVDPDLNF